MNKCSMFSRWLRVFWGCQFLVAEIAAMLEGKRVIFRTKLVI